MSERYELRKLVTVETFTFPWEAQVARARLASEGIYSIIADEHVNRLMALSQAVGGWRVQVREDDLLTASEVLLRRAPIPEIYLVTEEQSARRCPACGSGELSLARGPWVVLGFSLPIPRSRWSCPGCGAEWRADEIEEEGFWKELAEEPAALDTAADGGPDAAEVAEVAEEAGLEDAADGAGADGFAYPAALADSAISPAAEARELARNAALVTVGRYSTVWEAHIARTRLESEGIPACVLEERMPAVALLSGRHLLLNRLEVHSGDAPRATEILAACRSRPFPRREP
ncbi:MAG: DUF2007 domain-containing protein [Acidobacteriota bacterium]|nr:DUF2007 domain-containing protein [Acidobacteriota bacterium]